MSKRKVELTEEQYEELLAAKAAADKVREQRKRYWRRRQAKVALLLEKAKKAGITVSDKEVDEYLKKRGK